MAGNVYSTYELAKESAEERMNELEQDIFICSCKYNSSTEFVLKTINDMMTNADYLYAQKLPITHHFKLKKNAIREAERFSEELNRYVAIQRHTYEENGYNKFSHFTLCLT